MKPHSISAKFPSTKLSFHPVGQISHTTVPLNIWNSICAFQGWCPLIADLLFNSMDCLSLCAILYYLKDDPAGMSFCPFGRKFLISHKSNVHCKRKRSSRTYMCVTLQRMLFISHVSSCVEGSNCPGQLSRHTAAILPFCWRQFGYFWSFIQRVMEERSSSCVTRIIFAPRRRVKMMSCKETKFFNNLSFWFLYANIENCLPKSGWSAAWNN